MLEFVEDRKRMQKPQVWVNDGQLSPLELYCYLKARFGPANGLTMMARRPSTDNLIQWQYTLRSQTGHFIDFFGLNRHTEIMIHDLPPPDPLFWTAFVGELKKAVVGSAKDWRPTTKTLEKWHLFINPYNRLNTMARTLKDRLTQLDLKIADSLSQTPTRSEFDAHAVKVRGWHLSMLEAQLLGVALRMIAPVLAEAFVNMIFFLLAKSEVKSDQRLYEDFVRRQIDVRVRGLQLYCTGFARPIDANHETFKAFHSVMNGRNDFLHGNVDPKRMRFDEMFFDDTIPLFKDEKSLIERWTENSLRGIEREAALEDLQKIEAFVDFMLDHLQPEYRKEVEMVLDEEQLGWRDETQRVGILFGRVLGEFFPLIDLSRTT